jgi:hypothetical protein
MMQTVGDRSIMLFGVVSTEKYKKSSYLYNGSTLLNNSNIFKKLQFRAATFIFDHFDIVYYFQGLQYTFKSGNVQKICRKHCHSAH